MNNSADILSNPPAPEVLHSRVTCEHFAIVNGQVTWLFTLTNKKGHFVKISNYGGTVTGWVSADKDGKLTHNIIGFDDPQVYLQPHPFFGSLVGRYANRIAGGNFELEGKAYHLVVNNGPNHLHGGNNGFDKVIWEPSVDEHGVLHLFYLSKDGEEGYPGNLQVGVSYQFTDDDELIIEYRAKTDQPTPVNLTNHCYFDLSGRNESILDNEMKINASRYTKVDENLVPTGEIAPVQNTFLDFTSTKKIGDLDTGEGYDHNYVLDRNGNELFAAATVTDHHSGKTLELYTTEPGVQLYTANGLDGSYINREGLPIHSKTAFCLETQHFPDSPNQPSFPNTILYPGKLYESKTVYVIRSKK